MERNWTAEQSAAISARGGTLLVSAAAGSGKTAVLVERVIGLITDPTRPCDADRLLVVTFTNAAAAEMRERIARRLAEMIEQNPLDGNLQRQQMLLQNAHISTIHSFCLDLLREHFEKLDIPPDFRITDENEAEILRQDVLTELLEDAYAQAIKKEGEEAPFLALSRILSAGRSDGLLADTILRVYEFTRSLADAEGWLDAVTAMYASDAPVQQTVWGKTALSYASQALASAAAAHRRALVEINANKQLKKAYGTAFESDLAGLKNMLQISRSGEWDALCTAVSNFTFERLGSLRKFDDDALKEQLKAERDGVKKNLSNLKEGILCCTQDNFEQDRALLRPVVQCLCDTVRTLGERFFAEKLSRGLLDFSDLEQLTLKLLVERIGDGYAPSQTAREISRRFDEVLVDEYQDTNPAQDSIFCAVSKDESNLFMVGDVKQSIYSFRQARPEIFTQKAAGCTPYGSGFPAKIILGRNFRSRATVTNAVNFFFDRMMSPELGGVNYGAEEALIPGAAYFESGEPGFSLQIIDAGDYDGDEDNVELEARVIACEIKRLVDESFQVQGENGPRPVTYRDFAILLRSMAGRAEKYARALENAGIPVFADIGGGYLGAYEVMVMISLLRILDNPLQDIPLTAVLLSPVFGFTPDDVTEIRLSSKQKSLYLALLELSKNGDGRFDDFLALIGRLRTLAAVLPADRLILRVYDETGLLNIFEAMQNGELRRANLRLLLDYARAYESAGWRGLAGFIRFIDRIDRQRSDLAPASNLSENANVVRVMSIHKSKGLEFPVCFLAGLSKRFNEEDIRKPALFHPACGFGSVIREETLGCRFTTLPLEAVRLETKKSMLSEELRVLYVAMTRAREKLYAVMTVKNRETALRRAASIAESGEKLSPYAAMTAQSPADLLLAAALFHPSCAALRSEAGFTAPADGMGEWALEEITAAASPDGEATLSQQTAPEPDKAEVSQIKAVIDERMDFVYPHKVLSGLPSKISVSELTHGQPGGVQFHAEQIRPSFLEGDRLSPAEVGTALHAFMQYCSLDAIRDEGGVKAEIARLVAQRFILPEQGKVVDCKKVVVFSASPLFGRIIAAKQLWREFRFNIELPAGEILAEADGIEEKILLQGMADLVFEEDGGAVLLDYKTDHVQSAQELVERYRAQLDCYARAAKEILDLPIRERFIYSFALNCAIKV